MKKVNYLIFFSQIFLLFLQSFHRLQRSEFGEFSWFFGSRIGWRTGRFSYSEKKLIEFSISWPEKETNSCMAQNKNLKNIWKKIFFQFLIYWIFNFNYLVLEKFFFLELYRDWFFKIFLKNRNSEKFKKFKKIIIHYCRLDKF